LAEVLAANIRQAKRADEEAAEREFHFRPVAWMTRGCIRFFATNDAAAQSLDRINRIYWMGKKPAANPSVVFVLILKILLILSQSLR
jgi:hypothetical protein